VEQWRRTISTLSVTFIRKGGGLLMLLYKNPFKILMTFDRWNKRLLKIKSWMKRFVCKISLHYKRNSLQASLYNGEAFNPYVGGIGMNEKELANKYVELLTTKQRISEVIKWH